MGTHLNAARSTPAARAITSSLLASLALLLVPVAACAERVWNGGGLAWDDATAAGDLVDVQVLVQGHPAPLYLGGDDSDRLYVQAFKGRTYALSLHNRSSERIGVLIAVDGLNVVNGERSRLTAGEPMYVLGPWETAVIRGWRTSLDGVRQFVFVDEQRSYASRTDQANGDMGWIRVLSFRENRPLAWGRFDESWRRDRAQAREDRGQAPAPEAPGAAAPQKSAPRESATAPPSDMAPRAQESFPGTGWGDGRYDPARRVEFDAESVATDHLVLRYEYASGLRALGILPDRGRRMWEREHGQLGFAPPPRW